MAEPTIAARSPVVLELEPGTYWWCRCGKSQNQPYCDGSHKDTEFTPMEFTIEKQKKYALCLCKHTAKSPFCDGQHKRI